jgi:hypothetical protein
MGGEIRNPTTNETTQETADRMAGAGGNPPHPSAAATPQPKLPGPSTHPSAKGVYGAPVDPAPPLTSS